MEKLPGQERCRRERTVIDHSCLDVSGENLAAGDKNVSIKKKNIDLVKCH